MTDRVLSTQEVVHPSAKTHFYQGQGILYSLEIHVSDRAHSNREAGIVRSPSYETHTVASEVTLARTGESREGHSIAPLSPATPRLVAKREQCSLGPAVAPPSTRP